MSRFLFFTPQMVFMDYSAYWLDSNIIPVTIYFFDFPGHHQFIARTASNMTAKDFSPIVWAAMFCHRLPARDS